MTESHLIFPVPIWGFIVKPLSLCLDDYFIVINSMEKELPSEQKSNFGGWQSHDFLHLEPNLKDVFREIDTLCHHVCESHFKVKVKGELHSAWCNINYHRDLNLPHVHEGDLSGVLYLQVPDNPGRLILMHPALRSYAHSFSMPNYPIVPQPLSLIIFPSWLEHYVEPNLSIERRISISFNFKLKDE